MVEAVERFAAYNNLDDEPSGRRVSAKVRAFRALHHRKIRLGFRIAKGERLLAANVPACRNMLGNITGEKDDDRRMQRGFWHLFDEGAANEFEFGGKHPQFEQPMVVGDAEGRHARADRGFFKDVKHGGADTPRAH